MQALCTTKRFSKLKSRDDIDVLKSVSVDVCHFLTYPFGPISKLVLTMFISILLSFLYVFLGGEEVGHVVFVRAFDSEEGNRCRRCGHFFPVSIG